MQPRIHISEDANRHLQALLARQGVEGMGVKLFVTNPGTSRAETCLAYCRPGEAEETDIRLERDGLLVYLDKKSLPYLRDLELGLKKGEQVSQVTLRAPNAKRPHNAQGQTLTFERECEVKMVPSGEPLSIPPGAEAMVTQALGGSYTLLYHGNLIRVEGKDADALGLASNSLDFEVPADGKIREDQVWDALSEVYDPEIPVNIVELGLVYTLNIDQDKGHVYVEMTLTAPGCGMGDVLVEDVKARLAEVPLVQSSDVQLVFDPPWRRDMMSEAAQLETGMFF